ncbi:SDR family NAD(P)-dependent oxidoreductase [Hafnia paralvei]|uniref:SDR family oxidoreductase n=1 Tax=Hafnia paralvei TaxID=546367 RepID=A0A4Q9EKJ6_9GAMM|nr:SDR family oxidoreductase [Hafnia paralvei]TBM24117.1 SDR family oxidoreductase [Hafnia paralvei]
MSNKIALITGASRGLGKSMALHLAAQGIDVIITYRSQQQEAENVVQQIQLAGAKSAALPLDVSQISTFADFRQGLEQTLKQQWGRHTLDFLVNNAGIGINAPFAETSEQQFDQLMNIQLKGPFFLTQTLLPVMVDGGRILNISTGLSRFVLPGFAAYAAMKGAMEVLTRYQAKELGARGISVNILAPGAIETDFGGGVVRDNKEVNAFIASQTALGRVGLPEDIDKAVSMLLSDNANWVNGQRIEASGGMFL